MLKQSQKDSMVQVFDLRINQIKELLLEREYDYICKGGRGSRKKCMLLLNETNMSYTEIRQNYSRITGNSISESTILKMKQYDKTVDIHRVLNILKVLEPNIFDVK